MCSFGEKVLCSFGNFGSKSSRAKVVCSFGNFRNVNQIVSFLLFFFPLPEERVRIIPSRRLAHLILLSSSSSRVCFACSSDPLALIQCNEKHGPETVLVLIRTLIMTTYFVFFFYVLCIKKKVTNSTQYYIIYTLSKEQYQIS